MIEDCGLLVNSSRGIIYADSGEDFAEEAARKAKEMQEEMAALLNRQDDAPEGTDIILRKI